MKTLLSIGIGVALFKFFNWLTLKNPYEHGNVWHYPDGSTRVETKDVLNSESFKKLMSYIKNDD